MKTAIELIAEERKEQIKKHGWTMEHDINEHPDGSLKRAALYALTSKGEYEQGGFEQFQSKMTYKSQTQKLIIAAALLAAEIDVRLHIESIKP